MFWCCCGQVTPTPILETVALGAYDDGSTGGIPFVTYPSSASSPWFWLHPSFGTWNPLIRVNNLFVNQGTVVTSAELVLRGSAGAFSSLGTLNGDLSAWDADDTPDTDPGWTPANVQALPRTSVANAAIPLTVNLPSSAAFIVPVDVTAMVNTIVARPGWVAGNSILFILEWQSGPRADGSLFATAPVVQNGTHIAVQV